MKTFHCNRCSQLVFFENVLCERCEALLGYVPELGEISAFEPDDEEGVWRSLHPSAVGVRYRLCDNYALNNVCNWMTPADQPHRLCRSCELTTVIPNLASDENRSRWYRLETAKRRLLYTLAALELPVEPKQVKAEAPPEPTLESQTETQSEPAAHAGPQDASAAANPITNTVANSTPSQDESRATAQDEVRVGLTQGDLADSQPQPESAPETTATPESEPAAPASFTGRIYSSDGIAFEFLEETSDSPQVMTGHDHGLITLNIAEADDARREAMRAEMHEPYRTLLGHFRHEIGHYYFDLLVADTHWNAPFRAMFGDERADYGESLARHYRDGAPANWAQSYISAYASAHPWEDWAETWAHYLHMVDTLDTATSCGLKLEPDDPNAPSLDDTTPVEDAGFDALMKRWFPLTYALNSLNRSLGMPDGYPFTLAPAVVEKLRFVHRVIAGGVPVKQVPDPSLDGTGNA